MKKVKFVNINKLQSYQSKIKSPLIYFYDVNDSARTLDINSVYNNPNNPFSDILYVPFKSNAISGKIFDTKQVALIKGFVESFKGEDVTLVIHSPLNHHVGMGISSYFAIKYGVKYELNDGSIKINTSKWRLEYAKIYYELDAI